ncbi:zinc finger protein 574 isoform X2 [Scleropages formosus]|uniref:zinc finger protein 574 isoform X2 n=1 Tax=Scleropages formosus TaxID=113540 RepID=UPI0010FA8C2A|nr:zinc finger protein 574 isoform X2 [Scleropages formosus]
MGDQQEETEGLYVHHQYMCSECHQLFNTLEEVLVHQQSHIGPEGEDGEADVGLADGSDPQQGPPEQGESQYQCLECGTLLRSPEELLLHQELHMREGAVEMGQGELAELCEVVDTSQPVADASLVSGQIRYQCLECLALFDTPEVWLAHRQTHNKSGTHNALSDTEFVLQEDGSVTPLVNVQNLVLSEQQTGEILTLAQVLAAQQQQVSPLPQAPPRATFLPALSPLPASATLRLQICTAQALADGSAGPTVRRGKLLPPLLPSCSPLDASSVGKIHAVEVGLSESVESQPGKESEEGQVVIIHPYECSECALLFQTPEDFLQHQGEHFLGQDKESGEEGVMEGEGDGEDAEELDDGFQPMAPEENGRVVEDRLKVSVVSQHRVQGSSLMGRPRSGAAVTPPISLQCGECQRTFTSANRLAAHRRVHEHGTHECPECDKVFKKPASLQTHMRTHSGEARYLCVDCGHGFTTEMTLIIHRKSHTAEPLHRCQFCAKTFTNMTKFLYHRRTHTARTPPAPITMMPTTPRRLPLSHLSILQKAREQEEAAAVFTPLAKMKAEAHATFCETNTSIGTAAVAAAEENGLDLERNTKQVQAREEGETSHSTNGCIAGSSAPPDLIVTTEKMELSVHPALATSEQLAMPYKPPSGSEFPCPSCSKTFPSQLRLVRHRRTVHVAERRFKCGVCGKSFKKQIHVRNHLRTHTGERPFQCSDCGKTFSSLANLSRHGLTHSGLRPYRCDVCLKAFTQSSNLRQHRLLHINPAPCPCPDCPATFLRPAKLAAHRYTQHPGSPAPYPCPHCPLGFLRKRQRDRHCLEVHPQLGHADASTEPFALAPGRILDDTEAVKPSSEVTVSAEEDQTCAQDALSRPLDSAALVTRGGLDCSQCGKRLNSAANLRLHQLSHAPTAAGRRRATPCAARGKGHQCPVCGKLFVSSSGVALHQRVHTGERPFPCTQCGKRFRQNTHLREHLRTHSGERPFRCELCDKSFVQSMHLAEHRRTHTGERPHVCLICGKAFRTFSNLRNHRKTHARSVPEGEAQPAAPDVETVAVVDASAVDLATAVPAVCQQREPQVIQIQTQELPQSQSNPTIMCNEFGETIAIIESSEGGAVPLAEAIEIYHTALENTLGMDSIAVDSLQLL